MYPRTKYEMTEADLEKILDACKPVPCMMIGGFAPSSPQENANRAWAELGARMGFDHMTVEPAAGGMRFFTAVPNELEETKVARLAKEAQAKKMAEIESLRAKISIAQRKLDTLLINL